MSQDSKKVQNCSSYKKHKIHSIKINILSQQ